MVRNKFLGLMYSALLISLFAIMFDALFHFIFSHPFESLPYFVAKFVVYSIFAFFFLLVIKKITFLKTFVAGIIVASLWGTYYNILPPILHYSPFGIPLYGLSVLGSSNLLLVGLFFGLVHTFGFVVGVYLSREVLS
jgi:hypothetical protein